MTHNDFIRQVLDYLKSNPDDDDVIEKRDALIAFVEKATNQEVIRDAKIGIKLLEEELFDRQVLTFRRDRSA